MGELVEIEPGRWRVVKQTTPPARSALSCPFIISDFMPPTEQVDGLFYTSKSQFRAVGKSLGLIEVGNEKLKPKVRASADPAHRKRRREAIGRAIARYKAGERSRDVP
jgi:hypothetical protein